MPTTVQKDSLLIQFFKMLFDHANHQGLRAHEHRNTVCFRPQVESLQEALDEAPTGALDHGRKWHLADALRHLNRRGRWRRNRDRVAGWHATR